MAAPVVDNSSTATNVSSSSGASSAPDNNAGSTTEAPLFLGVNPKNAYGSSYVAKLLNKNITSDDVITLTIMKNANSDYVSKVKTDTVITMINRNPFSDQWLNFSSSYIRPLDPSSGSQGFGTSTVNSITGAVGNFNNVAKMFGGYGIQNKLKNLPIWGSTPVLNITINAFFIADIDPEVEVHQPIEVLTNMVLASTNKDNQLIVDVPGPQFDSSVWGALSDQVGGTGQSASDTAKQIDLTSLFSKGDVMFLKLGGLAEIGPVLLTRVVPVTTSQYTKVNGIKSFPYADVVLEFETYFAPQSNINVTGDPKDFDSVRLFTITQPTE
ncbi:MAG: hypothetical protein E6R13_02375 [Spirochaetes bacterium]|nr:MAG: hypothetical protein E6R13_02375 [Spirochaetota bacterium]